MRWNPGADRKRVLVLGLGNPLAGDDAFGAEVADLLVRDEELVCLAEIAQAGTDLLAWVEDFAHYETVILVDAVLDPGSAGQVRRFSEEELARWSDWAPSGHAISPLLAWRLFRELHPGSDTRMCLVAFLVSEVRPGSPTFEADNLIEAGRLVRESAGIPFPTKPLLPQK